jgi:hypothetical protein
VTAIIAVMITNTEEQQAIWHVSELTEVPVADADDAA